MILMLLMMLIKPSLWTTSGKEPQELTGLGGAGSKGSVRDTGWTLSWLLCHWLWSLSVTYLIPVFLAQLCKYHIIDANIENTQILFWFYGHKSLIVHLPLSGSDLYGKPHVWQFCDFLSALFQIWLWIQSSQLLHWASLEWGLSGNHLD